jgi:hypothetical protein
MVCLNHAIVPAADPQAPAEFRAHGGGEVVKLARARLRHIPRP